jgi:cation diffusion facilitator CzcD-associated flavoprotein CzcO
LIRLFDNGGGLLTSAAKDMSSLPRPRRALIVGGGAVGLVTLRNFLERGDFENVELVERRANIGGVW